MPLNLHLEHFKNVTLGYKNLNTQQQALIRLSKHNNMHTTHFTIIFTYLNQTCTMDTVNLHR